MIDKEYKKFSKLTDNLFMGGTEIENDREYGEGKSYRNKPEFDLVITAYKGAANLHPEIKELRVHFEDSESENLNLEEIENYADFGIEELKKGKKVLIRCMGGHNRSGLIAGIILIKLGMDNKEVVNLIKSKRGEDALTNYKFEKYLLNKESVKGKETKLDKEIKRLKLKTTNKRETKFEKIYDQSPASTKNKKKSKGQINEK